MQPDRDYIHALMIEKITGSISEPEGKFIDELIAKDAHVKEVYERLCSRFAPEDLEDNFRRLGSGDNWNDIPAIITRKVHDRDVIIRRAALAAAILTGVIIIRFYFPFNRPVTSSTPISAKTATKKAVQLQVTGGKTIDLSASKGQVQAGVATLNNAGKSLSYTANETGTAAFAENVLTVPVGLDYKISLSDGTVVWLNSATTLRFPFNFEGSTREITLNGEAYLQIARNAAKPFIVHTPRGAIRVLGTAFNVNTYDSGIVRVALVEGSVQVKTSQEEVNIEPGQEAVYTDRQKNMLIQGFDEDEVLSWQQGIHYFHNATIREICDVFPRWYGIKITIDNPNINNSRFTGILNRNEPLEIFLSTLKATTSVNEYYLDQAEVLHLK